MQQHSEKKQLCMNKKCKNTALHATLMNGKLNKCAAFIPNACMSPNGNKQSDRKCC